MKVSSIEAKNLLLSEAKARSQDLSWVEHSLCVGETAAKIATALNSRAKSLTGDTLDQKIIENLDDPDVKQILEKFYSLKESPIDVDQTKALGFLHDIGKIFQPYSEHLTNGYEYLNQQGFDAEYGQICLTHSFLSNDPDIMLSPFRGNQDTMIRDFIKQHEFTLAERIINLCDIFCECERWTLEKRLIDIMSRHGSYTGSQKFIHRAQARKAEFDLMLGKNLYNLFPEVSKNL